MHSDWISGIDILQGRWQHEGKVGYCYPSGHEKTLYKWEVYVPLVKKGLRKLRTNHSHFYYSNIYIYLIGQSTFGADSKIKEYCSVRRVHLGDLGVDGRIILRWIFRKWDAGLWTGSSWLRIWTDGGHL
jgi:hypothetical protein